MFLEGALWHFVYLRIDEKDHFDFRRPVRGDLITLYPGAMVALCAGWIGAAIPGGLGDFVFDPGCGEQ